MAYVYFVLFSFIFCHNFYLNSAEQQLSNSNKSNIRDKSNIRRVYAHQKNGSRNGSRDDLYVPRNLPQTSDNLYIATENPSNQTKRHSISGPVKTIDRDNEFYPKSFSDSSVNQNNKKKNGYSPLHMRHKKKPSPKPLEPITEKSEHFFFTNIRKNEIDLVKSYVKNPYLPIGEIVDNWGNTALHIAALIENFKIIKILLLDPRIDSSKRNNGGLYARDLLDKTQEKEGAPLASERIVKYKRMLFARSTLNILVNYHTQKMHAENNIDEKSVNEMVAIIKEAIHKTKEKQTSDLPSNALLPTYATDEFITLMLYYQLSLLSQKK